MRQELLRMCDVCKAPELSHFYVNILRGETVALVGMSDSNIFSVADILSEAIPIDSGQIWLAETCLKENCIRNPSKKGIFRIRKTSSLVPNLTVAENLFLVRPKGQRVQLSSRKRNNQQASMIFEELDLIIPPNRLAGTLDTLSGMILELIKVVLMGAELIILEDTWGTLSQLELENYFSLIRKLKDFGISFLILTHRHEQLHQFADRLVVLHPDGGTKTLLGCDYNERLVYRYLLGYGFQLPRRLCQPVHMGREVFRAEGLSCASVDHLNFSVHQNAILGISDPSGLFNDDFARIMDGSLPFSGSLSLNGRPYFPLNRRKLAACGIAVLQGGCAPFFENISWPENIALQRRLFHGTASPVISKRLLRMIESDHAAALQQLDGRAKISAVPVDEYTRVRIGYLRLIAAKPSLLVVVRPFLTEDIIIHEIIISMLRMACDNGIGVLVLSHNPDELHNFCDRTLLLSHGSVFDTLAPAGESGSGG